jgi:Flp pilus assembly protein TadG
MVSRGHAFARDDRGVTAIEFGILALPFFTIIFAILETTMVFFAGQVLDSAVEDASRMIKTGRAQAAGYNMTNFRTLMCGYTFNLFDCSKIRIRVKKLDNFTSTSTSTTPTTCTLTSCELTMVEDWLPGAGRDVVQVFAYYRWPLLVNLPYFNLKNQPDNYRLLGATRVFRNEPFT